MKYRFNNKKECGQKFHNQKLKYFLFLGVLQHTFYKLHASATETMSELNITLEHQHPITNNPSISQTNNNRFPLNDEETSRHPVSFAPATAKLRPAISSGSVHKSHSQIFVQDDMVLLNNARSSVFNHTMSAARSVNDLDQLPPMSAHQLSQNTLPAYRYYIHITICILGKYKIVKALERLLGWT